MAKPYDLPSIDRRTEDRQNIYSPLIRKLLPQTSILIAQKQFSKRLRNSEDLESSETFCLDNDLEMLTLPNNDKIIITKQLRVLYNDIITMWPSIKVKKDCYEHNSEVFKYLYTQDFKKIRNANQIDSNHSFIYLSKRPRIHKSEFIKESQKKVKEFQSYQIINFNQSISTVRSARFILNSLEKIPKILKSPEKESNYVKETKNEPGKTDKQIQEVNKKHLFPAVLDVKEKLILNKYKKPSNYQRRGKFASHGNELRKSSSKPEILNVPPRLYYELMRIPQENTGLVYN